MKLNRRRLLIAAPSLFLSSNAFAESLETENPRQRAVQSIWPLFSSLPFIRQDQAIVGELGPVICYMFTNKNCSICQGFHRRYSRGLRLIEMRYVIYPWPNDRAGELNYLYSGECDLRDYYKYMNGNLTIPRPSNNVQKIDRVRAIGAEVGRRLIIGNRFGTPFFLARFDYKKIGNAVYLADDVLGMKRFFDASI